MVTLSFVSIKKAILQYIFKNTISVSGRKQSSESIWVGAACSGNSGGPASLGKGRVEGRTGMDLWGS